LNDVIASTLGVTVRETLPDWIVTTADQVINLDISAEDLRERLRDGKIYAAEKIDTALRNFFTDENLTTLRELALREVASSVDRTREAIALRETGTHQQPRTVDRIMVAMSSDPPYTAALLRKASRIAGRLNSDWYCVYVQTPEERADRIDSSIQRKLVDNIQLAQSMGAEVVKLQGSDVAGALARFAREKGVTLLIVGQSQRSGLRRALHESVVKKLVNNSQGLDVLVVSFDVVGGQAPAQ
jgi:two-component system sensor histidine kinase KdpD